MQPNAFEPRDATQTCCSFGAPLAPVSFSIRFLSSADIGTILRETLVASGKQTRAASSGLKNFSARTDTSSEKSAMRQKGQRPTHSVKYAEFFGLSASAFISSAA